MKKVKIFSLRSGPEKAEVEINAWYAAKSEMTIISTAGVANTYFIVTYEE